MGSNPVSPSQNKGGKMTHELNDIITAMGRNAAMKKMSLTRNLVKKDMRLYSFADLQFFLTQEIKELSDELKKLYLSENTPSEKLLISIQDEAGDIIAFASGIVAKAIQEIQKQKSQDNKEPFLWEEMNTGNVILD